MGLIIHDEITLRNGMKIKDAYASFSGKQLTVMPGSAVCIPGDNPKPTAKWVLAGAGYSLWVSKDLCRAGFPQIDYKPIMVELTDDDLSRGVHQIAYDYIKSQYKNTEEC